MKISHLPLLCVVTSIVTAEHSTTLIGRRHHSRAVCFDTYPGNQQGDVTLNQTAATGNNTSRARRSVEQLPNSLESRDGRKGLYSSFPRPPNRTRTLLDKASTDLAFALLPLVTQAAWRVNKTNLYFSPHNIFNTLLLTYFGSAGETRRNISRAMFLDSHPYNEVLAAFTTSRNVTHDFVTDTKRLFHGQHVDINRGFEALVGNIAEQIDFSDPGQTSVGIAEWASDSSQAEISGRPAEKYPEETESLIFGVALFRLKWEHKFRRTLTERRDFTSCWGHKVQVDTMVRITSTLHTDSAALTSQVVDLPFERPQYRLLVFLPNRGHTLDGLISQLTEETLHGVIRSMAYGDIELFLPKFKTETRLDGVMKALGVEVFGERGNFSAMFDEGSELNGMRHMAAITVDETGTDGLVAQGAVEYDYNATVVVGVDRPFLYVIYNAALQVPISIGVLCDPIAD